MNLQPGIYEANSTVNIRREPRIVETKIGKQFVSNRVGEINAGTQRRIFSLLTNDKGETWGRVSQSDGAGISEWICVQNTNRVFMKPVDDQIYDQSALLERLMKLEAWARSKGYEE